MAESPDAESIHQASLREELEAARLKRDRYQALLKDLPEVFEGKFRERMRPVQQRNEQLLEEGLALREQIRRALPQATAAGALPPAAPPATAAPPSAADPNEFSSETPTPADRSPSRRRSRPTRLGERAGPGLNWPVSIPGGSPLAAFLVTGLALAGLAIGALLHRSSPPRPTPTASPITATPQQKTGQPSDSPRTRFSTSTSASASLIVRSTGSSWVEVQTATGVTLFTGLLEGQQTFPLNQDLRIRSGRADLIRIRVGEAAERSLGVVNMIDWQTIPAARRPG